MSRKSNQKSLSRSLEAGDYKPSSIGAKARAAANRLKFGGGKHAAAPRREEFYSSYGGTPSTGRHSKEAMLGGKHHAPAAQSAVKNAYGSMDAPARGRHSKEAHPKGNGVLTMKEAMSYNRKFTPSKQRQNTAKAA